MIVKENYFIRFARSHGEKLILVLLPFLFAAVNSNWVNNKSDIDIWFYYGYFNHFLDFWKSFSPSFAHTYYGTRLPYILPGHLVYLVFDEPVARYILNLFVIHSVIILSFFYVVNTHTSRRVAFVVSVMLASDIYFLRSIGSNYVDNGVLLYQTLTFAMVAKATHCRRPAIPLVISGFTAASMVVIHLLSALFLPVFLAYYLCFARNASPQPSLRKRLASTLLFVGVGALICLAFYGAMFVLLADGPFLFFMPQLKILLHESTENYTLSLNRLVSEGHWLTMHVAALVASVLSLLSLRNGTTASIKYTVFWIAALPLFYGGLALARLDGLWFLASRDGLYAPFFMAMSYLAIGLLLFRNDSLTLRSLIAIVFIFIGATILRLDIDNGNSLGYLQGLPSVAIGLFIGLVCFLSFAFGHKCPLATTAAACIVGLATLAIPVKFDGSKSVFEAHKAVSEMARGRLPKFFWTELGTKHLPFADIAASFTERAWWQKGREFPRCKQDSLGTIESGDLIVIMTPAKVNPESFEEFFECIGEMEPSGMASFKDRNGDYQLRFFEVPKVGRRAPFARSADQLPGKTGVVNGLQRIARESGDQQGLLTYGPYQTLSAGCYRLTFTYAATSDSHGWDAVYVRSGELVTVAKGRLKDTGGQVQTMAIDIDLSEPANLFEMRTFFSGRGELRILKVSAKPIKDATIGGKI